jgi:hypothetical protein
MYQQGSLRVWPPASRRDQIGLTAAEACKPAFSLALDESLERLV